MKWENYQDDIKERVNAAPGGLDITELVVSTLDLTPESKILVINPGPGVIAPIIAKEFNVHVTVMVKTADGESAAEESRAMLGVADQVTIIPGRIFEMPVPSEEFNSIISIGHPFNPEANTILAKEIYRAIAPDGLFIYAGPCGITNITPDYIKTALSDYPNVMIKTPAYAALMFAREGFHIVTAEFIPDAWDHWNEWLKTASTDILKDSLRRAIIEDGGRWLSLGLVILKKPPKPDWAV